MIIQQGRKVKSMQLPTWDLTVLIVIVLVSVLTYCLTGGRSSRGYSPSEDVPNVEEI